MSTGYFSLRKGFALALLVCLITSPFVSFADDEVSTLTPDVVTPAIIEEPAAAGSVDDGSPADSQIEVADPDSESGARSFDQLITPLLIAAPPTTSTLTVDPSGANGAYTTIQAAVDASQDGDTISIAAGTYEGFGVGNHANLTITAEPGALVVIHPTALLDTHASHKYTSDMLTSVYVTHSTNITIENLTITDNGLTPGNGGPDALVFWNSSTGTLSNDVIDGNYTLSGAQTGQGIAVDASSATTNLQVTKTSISGFQKNGIDVVDGNAGATAGTITLTVTDSTIEGAGLTSTIAQNGILVWNRAGGAVSATVSGTAISNLMYGGANASDTGVLVFGTASVPSVSNVSFSNVDLYLDQETGGSALDASTGNSFDGATLTSTSSASLSAIADKVVSETYPIYLLAHTVVVTPSNESVQTALGSAVDGDTVLLTSGSYAESPVVSKNVTLMGTSGAVLSGNATQNYVLKVEGTTGATLSNLTVNGGGAARGANSFDHGVWINGSGNTTPISVNNVSVQNIWNVSATGIEVDGSKVAVSGSTISSFDKRGIRFNHSSGTFHDNEVIGNTVDGISHVQNLVNLWGGSSVEIYGNKLHDGATAAGSMAQWTSPAIFVSSYDGATNADASTANIHNNEIYNDDTGVTVGSVYVASPATDSSNVTLTNNSFHDLARGVSFESASSNAAIHQNTFESVVAGVTQVEIDGGTTLSSVDARTNFWGSIWGPTVASNPNGNGATVDGNVAYSPWLCSSNTSGNTTNNGFCAPTNGSGGGSSGNGGSDGDSGSTSGGQATGSTSTGGSVGGGYSGQGSVLGASTFNFSSNLTVGATSESVSVLQKALIAAGYLHITAPTGYFGELTRAAVKAYQRANNLPATGFVGELTRAKLNLGVTPTLSDEQRSLIQVKLLDLLKQLAALQATVH